MRHRHPLVELGKRQHRQRLRHVRTSGKCEKPPPPDRIPARGRPRGSWKRAGVWQIRACRRPKKTRESPAGPYGPPRPPSRAYFSSTAAPCASSFFLISSASCLDTPSFTVPGAPSTRSLASLRPRLVIARISLMTWIFFSPPPLRMTVNSAFSSAAGEAPAPPAPPPAAPAPAAAAAGPVTETPNFSRNDRVSTSNSNHDHCPPPRKRPS